MKGGSFRGMVRKVREAFKKTHVVDDPVFEQHEHKPKVIQRPRSTRSRVPPCIPGTITYRDWLVRYYGYDRRRANLMLKNWRENGAELPRP